MIEFGPYLRRRREAAKLSLSQLGQKMGVTRQHVYSLEKGDNRPSAEFCTRLAKVLQLDSDEVLLLAGHTPPDVLSLLQENPQTGCQLLRRSLSGKIGP